MTTRNRHRNFWRDDRGAVAATYALSLVGLIAIAGVGMDYARLVGMDSELQNGADQAALAAATQLTGNTGACARAGNAAVELVSNMTLLARQEGSETAQIVVNGGTTITPAADQCGAFSGVTFYSEYDDPDNNTIATTDEDANYVKVTVGGRSVDYALLPVTGLLNSGAITGTAVAGLGSAICKVPPVMMCNPNETADPDFIAANYIGKGIRLVANDGGGYTPGNFGYLETDAGNGAQATAKTLGLEEVPGECVAADGVTTKPGEQVSVLDALNTRFGVYQNGLNAVCGNDGSLCPPSANARIDLLRKSGGSCSVSNAGFQVGPRPYRPTSSTVPLANTVPLDPMGYPRDMCHAVSNSGDCTPYNRIGNGVWDRNAYWRSHPAQYSTAPSSTALAQMAAYGDPNTPAAVEPTRYQVYRWEYANSKLTTATSIHASDLEAQGTPLCNAPGVTPGSGAPDRRVLSVAVINCTSEGVVGKTGGVGVVKWIDVFLVEPSETRGNGASKVSEKSDVYVEVIGETTLGGGADEGQEIRKDVPYLIE